MQKTLFVACAAILALSAGSASAQQAPRVMRADADNDGRISQAEFMGRLDRLGAADADRDGSVTRDERRAVMQVRVAERRSAAFDRLDANRDGALTRDEFDARPRPAPRARAAVRAHRGPAARHARQAPRVVDVAQARTRMAETFARLDADRDGYLTIEERRAGAVERRAHRREMRRAPASE